MGESISRSKTPGDGPQRRAFRQAVKKSPLRAPTRAVLLALVDRGMTAWPTMDTIAEDAGMSEKSARTHITAAEKAGWLVRERAVLATGRFGSYHYRFAIPNSENQRQILPLDQRQKTSPPAVNLGKNQRQVLPLNQKREPEKNLKEVEPSRVCARVDGADAVDCRLINAAAAYLENGERDLARLLSAFSKSCVRNPTRGSVDNRFVGWFHTWTKRQQRPDLYGPDGVSLSRDLERWGRT